MVCDGTHLTKAHPVTERNAGPRVERIWQWMNHNSKVTHMRKHALTISSATLIGAVFASAVCAQTTDPAQASVWVAKKLDFTYFGFTTTYSCDGLEDAVKTALLQLGARKDMVIQQTGCTAASGRPTPFPGVRVKMNVLQPADSVKPGTNGAAPVNAHWKSISLKLDRGSSISAPGTCELVEQINQKIVPLFTTRNVKFNATCIPHQQDAVGPSLTAEVLVSDEKAVASARN
jgi:hypothetical protein